MFEDSSFYKKMFEDSLLYKSLVVVAAEYEQAIFNFGSFNSAYEGYAVIPEELDELKAQVFLKPEERSISRMKEEATQVAAMAIRFVTDICMKE